MTVSNVLAGIAWDPEIRGALAVGVGVLVLMGSVYLLLGTNLGNRLGFLVALTGFFGWMVILGVFWWIKPSATGPAGRAPSWQVEEINTGDLDDAIVTQARQISGAELPDHEALSDLTAEEFEEAVAPFEEDLGDWDLLPASDPSRGEAQSVAEETLVSDAYPGITEADDFVVLYGMEAGGKPDAEGDGTVDRVLNKVTNTLRLTHPPHYAVVQVVPARFQETVPGEAPPTPEPAEGADVISVVMVRELGEWRLPPAILTIVSGALFGLLCYMLHVRDKTLMANRSAPLPEPTPNGEPVKAGV